MIRALFSVGALLATASYVAAGASSYQQNAVCTSDQLMRWYSQSTGTWNNYWWEAANMMSALADLGELNPSYNGTYFETYANTLAKAPKTQGHSGFINDFYDDEGWWGLAWLRVYDLTKDQQYLNQAIALWNDMKGGATTPCGGGIWWSKDKKYIASIANGLYIQLGASLANRVPASQKQTYLQPAEAAWEWFMRIGVVGSDHYVVDGVDPTTCKPTGAVYTYNQGLILGAAVELARATGNAAKYLDPAAAIADAATSRNAKLTDADGILVDGCDRSRTCGGDGEQFKGPFVKNLKKLYLARPKQQWKDFIVANAQSMWVHDVSVENNGCLTGAYWAGPYSKADASTQSVALDLLNAAQAVTR